MNPEELRLKAIEIAERSTHSPYISGGSSGTFDVYRDKDFDEILRRARRIVAFVQAIEDEPSSLINRLKSVLCEDK